MRRRIDEKLVEKKSGQVPPRFELGSLDSKSRVLTITPWDLLATFCFIDKHLRPIDKNKSIILLFIVHWYIVIVYR